MNLNVVFIIPTGVGCKIGGHAGDATPAARLIAQTCNKLILHPNVVNASDINEMPVNSLYVEGSILDRFLQGEIELQEVISNKVLVAVSPPIKPETINAINAAKATLGMNIEIVELDIPLLMDGWVSHGIAGGRSHGVNELIGQVKNYDFDALAIASPIHTASNVALDYFNDTDGGINPWGWIESRVSQEIALSLNKPVAHAPIESDDTKNNSALFNLLYEKIVDKRKAAEVCSNCYIHCVLKGLHRAPRIGSGISRESVACLITPTGVVGTPHYACLDYGIPVISIDENTTALSACDHRIIRARNYLEAAGMVNCIMSGIQFDAVLADG